MNWDIALSDILNVGNWSFCSSSNFEQVVTFGIKNVRIEYVEPRQGGVLSNFSEIYKVRILLVWALKYDIIGLKLNFLDWHLDNRGSKNITGRSNQLA